MGLHISSPQIQLPRSYVSLHRKLMIDKENLPQAVGPHGERDSIAALSVIIDNKPSGMASRPRPSRGRQERSVIFGKNQAQGRPGTRPPPAPPGAASPSSSMSRTNASISIGTCWRLR